MPINEIMQLNTSGDEDKKILLMLAIHCSPILKGSKAANIMTVTGKEYERIGYLLKDTGISSRFIKAKGDTGILYLYRKDLLTEYLFSEEIQYFLTDFGYHCLSLNAMLDSLSDRIVMYNDGELSFPHEIGVFLEYPLLDVKGFLKNNGKNFIYSGYWKVYGNVNETIGKFRQYDKERNDTIRDIAAGKSIRDIVMEANLR